MRTSPRRTRRRAPARALRWASSADAQTHILTSPSGEDEFTDYNTLILAPDVGPGAGQVIEADNITLTRIVGTVRWDAIPDFEEAGDVIGWRFNFGFLKMSEPRDPTIVISLESPDDLATFDWLHVRHLSPNSTESFTSSHYLTSSPTFPIDIRVQRRFGQQDSLVFFTEARASLLSGTDQLTVSYRWDLRILLRMA